MVRGVRGFDKEGVTSCIFIYLLFLHLRIRTGPRKQRTNFIRLQERRFRELEVRGVRVARSLLGYGKVPWRRGGWST